MILLIVCSLVQSSLIRLSVKQLFYVHEEKGLTLSDLTPPRSQISNYSPCSTIYCYTQRDLIVGFLFWVYWVYSLRITQKSPIASLVLIILQLNSQKKILSAIKRLNLISEGFVPDSSKSSITKMPFQSHNINIKNTGNIILYI